ncbi:hypothetical protein L484_002682 [Morus notabilis]|uniref:Uncharacterized protein n=1 Tax=Morus notabilis TaxID=981085 RepID=W9RJA0_9ROSA|nr:hypothetical protein L484_002682 [Morus notabilis]
MAERLLFHLFILGSLSFSAIIISEASQCSINENLWAEIRGGGQDRRKLVGREEEDLASVEEEEIVRRRRKSWAEMGSEVFVVAVGQPEVLVAVGGSHLRRWALELFVLLGQKRPEELGQILGK